MTPREELIALDDIAVTLHKLLLKYNVNNNNVDVERVRSLVNDISNVRQDVVSRNSGSLTALIEERCAISAREDFCHLLFTLYQVFNEVIGKRKSCE